MIRRMLLTTLSFALLVTAADKPSFTGNWHIDQGKSELTGSQLVKKVQQSDDSITIDNGKNSVTLKLDGKANDQGVSAKLEGATLVMRTKHDKMTLVERWTVSADGKTLTVASQASGGPAGPMNLSQVYNKE